MRNDPRSRDVALLSPISVISALIKEVALEALKSLLSAKKQGANIQFIPRSEALKFTFPPGHPRKDIVYVQHPVDRDVYFTVTQFHRLTFEHKFSEAVRILMSLGAKRLEVQHVRGWSGEFAAGLSVPLNPGTSTGAGVAAGGSASSGILFEAELEGAPEPKLPAYLVWYHNAFERALWPHTYGFILDNLWRRKPCTISLLERWKT